MSPAHRKAYRWLGNPQFPAQPRLTNAQFTGRSVAKKAAGLHNLRLLSRSPNRFGRHAHNVSNSLRNPVDSYPLSYKFQVPPPRNGHHIIKQPEYILRVLPLCSYPPQKHTMPAVRMVAQLLRIRKNISRSSASRSIISSSFRFNAFSFRLHRMIPRPILST